LCLISGGEQAKQGKQGTSSQQQQRDDFETYRQKYLSAGKFNADLVAVSRVIMSDADDADTLRARSRGEPII